MTSDLVSVVIPVYNMELHLRRCLKSVIQQTYKNIEVIIVNDGSVDNSLQICKTFEHNYSNITVINKNNGGVSTCRNIGLNHAKGKYVCFIDSDDYVCDDYVEKLIRAYDESELDVVVCAYYKENKNGQMTLMSSPYDELDRESAYQKIYVDNNFSALPWNKLYRMDIIKKYSLRFDESLKMTQDLVFNTEYFAFCTKIKYIQEPLYYYAYNGNSVCRTAKTTRIFNRKIFISLKAHDITRQLIKNESLDINNAFSCREVCTYLRVLVNMSYARYYDKELFEKIKLVLRSKRKYLKRYGNYSFLLRLTVYFASFSPISFYYFFSVLCRISGIDI